MYLDDATMKKVRDAINSVRKPGAYQPGQWSVGNFNRDPKALGTTPPKKVQVRDITLRTIEESLGVGIRSDEKVLLAEALAKAGVPSLQLTYFGNGFGADESLVRDLVKRIKQIRPGIELCLIVTRNSDMELAARLGIDKVKFAQSCMVSVIPAFLYGAVWEGRDWRAIKVPNNVEQQIERWLRLIEAAKRIPVKISIGQNMASYATEEYLRQMVPPLAEAGADEFAFSDSFRGLGPDACRYLCHLVKEIAPKMTVSVHIHNDWGMGTASCIASVLGGADIVEATVNGMGGPGVGQADLAEVVAALEVLYGIDTGIDMKQLTSLSRLVADITRRQMPSWKPITGEHAWDLGGVDEMLFAYEVDPLFPLPVNPEIFGNKFHLKGELGCASGNWSMYYKLQELGIEVDKSRVSEILKAVKAQIRLRKRPLTDDEIRDIAT